MRTCCSPWRRKIRSSRALSSPLSLKLERLQRARMEQFLGLDQPRRQALRMVMLEKALQRLAVGLEPVGPEVLAHQRARLDQPLLDEGQRHLGCRGVAQQVERGLLRLLEGLEHRAR